MSAISANVPLIKSKQSGSVFDYSFGSYPPGSNPNSAVTVPDNIAVKVGNNYEVGFGLPSDVPASVVYSRAGYYLKENNGYDAALSTFIFNHKATNVDVSISNVPKPAVDPEYGVEYTLFIVAL